MRPHIVLVVGVALLIAAADPNDDDAKQEIAKFQGTWKFVSMGVEGNRKPVEQLFKYTVVVEGDRWTVSEADRIVARFTINLDPVKTPKTIDLVDTEKKSLIRGIYRFEGDALTVCDRFAEKGDRPTEFSAKPDSGALQFVLKRVKPSSPSEDVVKQEAAKFQGTWKFVSMEVEGARKPDVEFNKYTVVLKGDQWTVSEGDKIAARVTFKLDPASKPRSIDLVDVEKKRLIRGIYSLEGDTLTVCDRGSEKGDRPTEFLHHPARPNSGFVQFVLKRAKHSQHEGDAGK